MSEFDLRINFGIDLAKGKDRNALRCGCGALIVFRRRLPRNCCTCGCRFIWPDQQQEESIMSATTTPTAGAMQTGAPPPHDDLLQFFAYAHLPEHLQAISKPFGDMAQSIVQDLPSNPERTMALRKLLEAKDCAVRAFLFKA